MALAAALTSAAPFLHRVDAFTIDSLFWLRHQVYGPLWTPADSPSVVIALDEETYRHPPFEGLPKAMWTPQLAKVLRSVLESGALVNFLSVNLIGASRASLFVAS